MSYWQEKEPHEIYGNVEEAKDYYKCMLGQAFAKHPSSPTFMCYEVMNSADDALLEYIGIDIADVAIDILNILTVTQKRGELI